MTNNSPWEPSRYDGDQQFGVRIPRDHNQAVQFDDENGVTRWQDAAEKKEIYHLFKCIDFDEQGHRGNASAPEKYNRTLSFVYACKYDGRYKSRMVAGGHLTDPPVDNDYSGAVSLNSTPHSIAYPPGLNPFDEEDVQPMLHNSGYALRFVYQIVTASCFGFYVRTVESSTHEIAYLSPEEHRRRDINNGLLSHHG